MDMDAGGGSWPSAVLPRNYTPENKLASDAFLNMMEGWYKKHLGRDVKGRTRYAGTRDSGGDRVRGRGNTNHAELGFGDDKALLDTIRKNPEALADYADVVRNSYGAVQGAQIGLSHGGLTGRDKGAHWGGTNEVEQAQRVMNAAERQGFGDGTPGFKMNGRRGLIPDLPERKPPAGWNSPGNYNNDSVDWSAVTLPEGVQFADEITPPEPQEVIRPPAPQEAVRPSYAPQNAPLPEQNPISTDGPMPPQAPGMAAPQQPGSMNGGMGMAPTPTHQGPWQNPAMRSAHPDRPQPAPYSPLEPALPGQNPMRREFMTPQGADQMLQLDGEVDRPNALVNNRMGLNQLFGGQMPSWADEAFGNIWGE